MEIIKKKYDYIIIGGGPVGLTIAWILAKENKDILLIESEKELGGCHRVERVNGLFAEHGPRVYSDAYLNFIQILESMDIKFDDIMTQYNFDLSNIGLRSKLNFTTHEYASFIIEFIRLIIDPNYSREIPMSKHMNNYNFTEDSKDYVDRLCRLTDGATADKYTLFQFLQLVNQQSLYRLCQPRLPNDRGLILLWKNALLKTKKVNFLMNHDLRKLIKNKDELISSILVYDKKNKKEFFIKCRNCILSIPPKPLIKLLNNSKGLENSFGDINKLSKWSSKNSYFHYIPITLHYKQKLKLPKVWGFPKSDWGVAFIVLSDYMEFNDEIEKKFSNTVISTCISYTDRKSSFSNKTANECTIDEIYDEVFRQLKLSFPDLPNNYKMVLSPQVKKDTINNIWINYDTAFISSTKLDILNSHSAKIKNLYTVGTHNGNSLYYFTSMESAVQNAIVFCHSILPETEEKYKILDTNHLTSIIIIVLIICLVIIFLFINKKNF